MGADSGTLTLLRPLLPRPSVFHTRKSSSRYTVHLVIPLNRQRFSYKILAAVDNGNGYRRNESRKRGRKRRQLWEELLEDNVKEDSDGDNSGNDNFDLWKILVEIVDNVWILKAFKSYGYLLPFVILSLFFITGPKAFLVSLAVAIGPSLLFFAFQKLIGWDKGRQASIVNQFGVEMEEEEGIEKRSRVRYDASSVSRGVNRGMASEFGGWDELDGLEAIPEQPRKMKPIQKRKRVRREEVAQPLLLRLLVSLFPFLSSYINMRK